MAVLPYPALVRLGVPNPRAASFDVPRGPIYRIPRDLPHTVKLRDSPIPFSYLESVRKPLKGNLVDGESYCTDMFMPPIQRHYKPIESPRSSVARTGLMVRMFEGLYGVPDGVVPHFLRTRRTTVHLPDSYSLKQAALVERGTRHLTKKQVKKALNDGLFDIKNPIIDDDGTISVRSNGNLRRYDGSVLNPAEDLEQYFIPIPTMVVNPRIFHLGSTEWLYIGPRHMGILVGTEDDGEVTLAEMVHPESLGNQALEVYFRTAPKVLSRGRRVAKLFLYELAEDFVSDSPSSRFSVQNGTTANRSLVKS